MTSFTTYLKNISLYYHQKALFENLNLELPQGQCIALLGPSGVGKTSLLHRIAGLDLGGDTTFSGSIYTSDSQSLHHRVMLMTQQDGLLPWLNVLDNAILGFKLRKNMTDEVKQHAESLLISVGLIQEDFCKKPYQLSGGMRQRVALVRALIEDKQLLLLDEPFSALDAITRYKLQDIAAKLWQSKTVLLITHDPMEALRLADQIYIMRGRPATLEKLIVPIDKPPREISSLLAEYQAKILELLTVQ